MTRRRRRALASLGLLRRTLASLGLLLLAAAASGQPTVQGHGGLPGGEGRIVGRVVHEDDRRPAAGQDVVLYTVGSDGVPGLAMTVADAEGAFRFEGLATDPDVAYLVGSRSGAVPFGSRVAFSEGQTRIDVELEIAALSGDVAAVRTGTAHLRVDRSCEGLRVNEAHELSNPGSRVVFVPEPERDASAPVFEAELPAEASDFFTPLGDRSLGLEVSGTRVRYWGPVYPGGQELEFGYALPLGSDGHERRFPLGAGEVVFLSDESGVEIRGEQLAPDGTRPVEGRHYRAMTATGMAPGAGLRFQVSVGEASEPVTLTRSEIWIEADDAVLTVNETHMIRVEGAAPLTANAGAPLLCLPLPAGAESLRFSTPTLEMGIEADPSGALAFRGPLPAGASALSLSYSLPVGGDAATFSRRLGRELPVLNVLIADTGVVPESTRLHRRRSTNRGERRYLHLEAFSVEPDETLEIVLRRLDAPRPLSRWASAGFTGLAALAVVAFLSGPLRGARREQEAAGREPARLAAEREALYAAIRDLDEDFETDKLTPEDHDALRSELKARAVHLLERERRLAAAPTPPRDDGKAGDGPRAVFCIACGARLLERARFCSQCGEKVGGGGTA